MNETEHPDMWDTRHSQEFVSPFANFSSSLRSRSSKNSARTRVPLALEATPSEVGRETKAVSPPPGIEHNVDSPALDFLSVFFVFNTLTDYIALALLAASKKRVETLLMSTGLIFALVLRFGAVYQYYERVSFVKGFLNIFFGSRFGWSEQYDKKLLAKAHLGVQFGFPLIMHSVADIVQHGFTFYPLFVIISGGTADFVEYYVPLAFSLLITGFSMLGSLLVRLSYGATLIQLSLLVVYGSLFVTFSLFSFVFDDFDQDKLYTRNVVFPWLRFVSVVTTAFTTTAVEVRQHERIILPAALSTLIGSLFIIDIVCVLLIRTDADTFIDTDIQDLNDARVVVDQLMYTNVLYGTYICMFMFIQWRLLTYGHLD